jgi:hypothetical protein
MGRRYAVHFFYKVWTRVPTSKVGEVAAMLKEMKIDRCGSVRGFRNRRDLGYYALS